MEVCCACKGTSHHTTPQTLLWQLKTWRVFTGFILKSTMRCEVRCLHALSPPEQKKCKLIKAAIIDFWLLEGKRKQEDNMFIKLPCLLLYECQSRANIVIQNVFLMEKLNTLYLNHKRDVVCFSLVNFPKKGDEIANTAGLHSWILVGLDMYQ